MLPTKTIWKNGQQIPWEEVTTHVLTHALHYGTAAFEGIRAYATDNGPAIFRLREHVERLVYSAKALHMEVPYSVEEIEAAIIETVKVNDMKECYIRPLIYYGYEKLGVNPTGCPVDMIIAVWEWGQYLGTEPARIQVSDYIRIHPDSSVTDAKITGHYVNSMLAGFAAKQNGYTEALLLDYKGNIAEGPGENFFMIKGGVVSTPPLGTILKGITRNTILTIMKDMGLNVQERSLTVEEAKTAEECFYTGTAAEVTYIASIDDVVFPKAPGEVSEKVREAYMKIVKGEDDRYEKWLTLVS